MNRYSWTQRLRSARNDMSLRIANRIRFSRGIYVEHPCGQLDGLNPAQARCIATLRARYDARFETQLATRTCLNNYAYLDIMDQAWRGSTGGAERPTGGLQVDVGCANFWYAASLNVFFRPSRLVGVEVDAFRRYFNGYTRADYARGYTRPWPQTSFRGQNFMTIDESADRISCWFPFVTAAALLAWGLPLGFLDTSGLFSRISANLSPGGTFFMVNHGETEAQSAARLCETAGLRRQWLGIYPSVLQARLRPAVASCWRH